MSDRNVDLGNHKGVDLSHKYLDPLGTGAGMSPYVAVQGPAASGVVPVGNPTLVAGVERATGLVRVLGVDVDGEPKVNLEAGTNIIGKVGIDQTTDGTTNRVNPQGTLDLDTTVSFTHGEYLSPAVDLAGKVLCGFIVPSGWRASATAITFQMSPDNSRWFNLYGNSGNEVTATVAPSRCITLNPSEWAGLRYLKFRSGTAASGIIQQANDDILTLMTRSM